MESKAQHLRENLQVAVDNLCNENQALIADILTQAIIPVLDRFQNKVSVGLQDSVSDLLNQFKYDIENEIFTVAENWTLATKQEEKFLFPKNCRFAYSKGLSTIVVIEQPPGVRTIHLDEALLTEYQSNTNRSVSRSLLFPYVIFILHWKRQQLVNLFTVWNNKSIQSLKDRVYSPLMPNLHKNYRVCTGSPSLPNGDISKGCEKVISDYWQSVFNTDLSEHWWLKSKIPELRNVNTWEENSDNPFLFNEIKLPSRNKTLEDMIDFCLESDVEPNSVDLRKRLSLKIESCSNEMFSKLMKYFKKKKFDRLYPEDVQKDLAKSLVKILEEIYEILTHLEKEVECASREKQSYNWQPKSQYWRT